MGPNDEVSAISSAVISAIVRFRLCCLILIVVFSILCLLLLLAQLSFLFQPKPLFYDFPQLRLPALLLMAILMRAIWVLATNSRVPQPFLWDRSPLIFLVSGLIGFLLSAASITTFMCAAGNDEFHYCPVNGRTDSLVWILATSLPAVLLIWIAGIISRVLRPAKIYPLGPSLREVLLPLNKTPNKPIVSSGGVLVGFAVSTIAIGFFIFMLSLIYVTDWSIFLRGFPRQVETLLGVVVMIVMVAFSLWAINLVRALIGASAKVVSGTSTVKPILFLRSFLDENIKVGYFHDWRLEEILASTSSWSGPMIAIGNPTERIPKLGSYRTYESNDDWQSTFFTFLEKSEVIVLMAGPSPWVEWEFSQIQERHLLKKTVLILPAAFDEERLTHKKGILRKFGARVSDLVVAKKIVFVSHKKGGLHILVADPKKDIECRIGFLAALLRTKTNGPDSGQPLQC